MKNDAIQISVQTAGPDTLSVPSRNVGDLLTRALGIVALLGVAFISAICLAVQFLRTDLDWMTVEMSMYVVGRYGGWVQASFFASVPAIAALGVGWYHALGRHTRDIAPMALFVIGAIALGVMATHVADPTQWPTTLHGAIHMWSAFAAFICVTAGMLVQSCYLRLDPRWHRHWRSALMLAVVTVVYFWVYALVKPIPRGLGEKVIIGLILLWLWRAAWWLVRGSTIGTLPSARTRNPGGPAP